MDNLPAPVDGKRPPVTFWAPKRVYRPDDFVKIPSQYGYDDIDHLAQHGLDSKMDQKAANTFLQEWLYFGVFSRVIDEEIDATEFHDSYNNMVQTRDFIIENKLKSWKNREAACQNTGSSSAARARYVRASDALLIARRFISKHVSHGSQEGDDGRPGHSHEVNIPEKPNDAVHHGVDTALTLSIAVLGEILQRERPAPPNTGPAGRDEFWEDPSSESRRWGYSKYCRDQLKQNNWCPSEIMWLESTMTGVCEVYYASSICRKRQYDHSTCTGDKCTTPPLETAGHVEGECFYSNCPDLGLDEAAIERVINDGKTPLVTWSAHEGLRLRDFDLKSAPPPAFGALSHAWEDMILNIGKDSRGGNNRRVYECQLRKMQKDFNTLVRKRNIQTPENVPFYVDALCYPRQLAVQAIALNQMQVIYSKAAIVLVWDRNLLSERKLSPAKTIEMNVKIRTGNWTKSLWTLLEAVLASKKSIAVAFSDETVSFDELELAKESAEKDLFHDYHHIYQAGYPFSHAIHQLHKLETMEAPNHRPQVVWSAVQFQKIDRIENEAPILAALMKVDVTRFASGEFARRDLSTEAKEDKELTASRRMMRLLEAMNETPGIYIPSGLIFLPAPGLRNDKFPETKQYGWAPRTWLNRQAHPRSLVLPLRTVARTHPKGLLVHYSGLALLPVSSLVSPKFWVPVTQSMHKWYKVVAFPPAGASDTWWAGQMENAEELLIILSEWNPREKGAIGLLVKPKGLLSNGQIQWVDSLCQVWVRLETDRELIKIMCLKFREDNSNAVMGTRIAEQEWCVDGMLQSSKC